MNPTINKPTDWRKVLFIFVFITTTLAFIVIAAALALIVATLAFIVIAVAFPFAAGPFQVYSRGTGG